MQPNTSYLSWSEEGDVREEEGGGRGILARREDMREKGVAHSSEEGRYDGEGRSTALTASKATSVECAR